MRKLLLFIAFVFPALFAFAQQLPNANFEDWSGAKFDGKEQPKSWNVSNVEQVGFKFNFAHKEAGRTGYCVMVQDQVVGALGITETGPGYFSLGKPWQHLEGISTSTATAGTSGGMEFTFKPDTMSVWIRRVGENVEREDFYLLYYAWTGTAKSNKYKAKNGSCTSIDQTNEESDIRLALDANECGTQQKATQVSEGLWREMKHYEEWTNIRVPIYYMNNVAPTMMNIIFSASNYPNFRANTGLFEGNSLYVDDVELIYSSAIQKLYIDDKEWKGFDPNTSKVQIYSLGEDATEIPKIEAMRGAGSITNAAGTTVNFVGRTLSGLEITIQEGDLENKPTVITVNAEDGSSATVYKIQFKRVASSNTKLAAITANGQAIAGFSPTKYNYTIDLPYGTVEAPVIAADGQEYEQKIEITQAKTLDDKTTILVTAANGVATAIYTIDYKVAELADNTLMDILVNGKSVPGFTPTQAVYKVSLSTTTTAMPTVEAVSAYPKGEQTIVYKAPDIIDGGVYQISVTTPGNTIAKVYKLNFKLEASSYTYLQDLKVEGGYITNFSPEQMTYYVNLPIGTTTLPKITWTAGDEFQSIVLTEGGLDGTTRVTVTAGNGDQAVYKIVFSTEKSEISTLAGINIGGEPLAGFDPNTTTYNYTLPIGTTELPTIEIVKGDEYQTVNVVTAGVNGRTRITVTAGDGSTTVYQIVFSVQMATNATLKSIKVNGVELEGYNPEVTEYYYNLPQGTTQMPEVTYVQNDEYQTVTVRNGGLNGDYKITVRSQSGNSNTYIIHFSVTTSSNTALKMIYLNGTELAGFNPEKTDYSVNLPEGVSVIPNITFTKAEESQKVLSVLENKTQYITVTAENGTRRIYSITFVVQLSENAFLEMIYLDGAALAGFKKDVLSYTVQLTTPTCPIITVDKALGQQVTILAPYAAGTAQIKVQPEQGSANVYVIKFEEVAATTARLQSILVNGVAIAGFDPTKLNYTSTYEHTLPNVSYVKGNDQQMVSVLWKDSVAWLHVDDALGNKTAYSVSFSRIISSNNALKAILIDGTPMPEFNSTTKDYKRNLPAGSTYPEVGYIASDDVQVVFFGQTQKGKWEISVAAENGDIATYSLQFNILPYEDATLANIEVEGHSIVFESNTFVYSITLDEGEQLPAITVTVKDGQTVLSSAPNDQLQQIVVTAENGNTNTYKIEYTRAKSANALLEDILVDGVSVEGFAPTKYNYTISLPQGTEVVPNVFPIGQLQNQTITTYFCKPDGTLQINIVAQDGTEANYYIEFPLKKSANTALGDLYLDSETVEISFDPNTTEYVVEMPYQTTKCPKIIFEKAEPEQRIDFISRPLGQKSELIVVAENGETRTYSILFKETLASEANRLRKIYIVELDEELNLNDKTKRDFEVNIPFGSRTLTIEYEKMFPEQTVFVQPGGVHNPTIITLKSNRPEEADEIYTITPILPTEDPAVLVGIEVNGVSIENYNPENFSYIVPVTEKPVIRYTLNKGAEINILTQTSKHWQAEVSYGGRTNIYNVWYYYVEEQVPNLDFTEWSNAAVLTSSKKPTGWNGVADALGKHSGFFSFTPDDLVTENGNSAVRLKSKYSTPGGGTIPGFITLGKVSGKWGVSGSSTFTISGGISFHNSPDIMQIHYKLEEVKGNNSIQYNLTGSDGEMTLEWKNSTTSDYKTYTYDLSDANKAAGDPTVLNIVLNSFSITSSQTDASLGGTTPNMSVDWMRFSYNHTLTAIQVDEFNATKNGNVFTARLTDPERIELPVLAFTGEVNDQAQTVIWEDVETQEGDSAVRTANIRNFAENGVDYTDYTLKVVRPMEKRNKLADLMVDSATIDGFLPDKTSYTIHMPAARRHMNDIRPVAASSLQKIVTTFADSMLTITVTPEWGEATVYTVRFVTDLSNDTTLADITAEGLTYNPSITNYEIAADIMPLISYAKKSDLQTVSLINGVITVTAENGQKGTYTIKRVDPIYVTTGQIAEFEIGTNIMTELGGSIYACEKERPEEPISFKRAYQRDSVVFIQDEVKMQWDVYGTEKHTYTLTYPTALSNNADLAGIKIGGVEYDKFESYETEYVIYSDTAIWLEALPADIGQTIAMTQKEVEGGVEYTIEVTAENGINKKQYSIQVLQPKSNIATLAGILLDSVMVADFNPNTYSYTVILPTPEIKTAQPQMPSVTYIVGQEGQKVLVEPGLLDEPTHFTVTSEDGTVTTNYELMVKAEPSHCVDLSGITVNGVAMDYFEPGRHFYSTSIRTSNIVVDYTTNDNFQTVTIDTIVVKQEQEYKYILHVVAEDGVTSSDYQVEIYVENKSTDAFLANITLDGKNFNDFERALNEDLTFDQGNNNYTIFLPTGTTILPEVNAQLKMDGQVVQMEQKGDSVLLYVTAVDGVSTNTYTLHFIVPLSTNADLSMIFLNGDSLEGFTPNYYFYQVELPVGVHTLPEVVGQKGEAVQTILPVEMDYTKQQATIRVQAEDENARMSTYVIVFHFNQSAADTLNMIYADGLELKGFDPYVFYYNDTLPVGTKYFPTLSWEYADDWQTITMDTVLTNAMSLIRQIVVTAENGKKNTYTIAYTIEKSAVDTLQMIFINHKQLPGFKATTHEYFYTLTAEEAAELNGEMPIVEYIMGDEYQSVVLTQVPDSIVGKSLKYKSVVAVTAANGATRTYAIHYPIELSSNAALNMIFLNGKPIDNFDAERFNYREEIQVDAAIPVVTVSKKEAGQQVEILIEKDNISIVVTAENGVTKQTYTLMFERLKSSNTMLRDIILTDMYGNVLSTGLFAFRPEIYEYTITMPYDPMESEELPNIETILYEDDQTVVKPYTIHELSDGSVMVVIRVIAPNGENESEYSLIFRFTRNNDAALTAIYMKDTLMNGFDKDITEYDYELPFGATDADLLTLKDISYQLSDTLAVDSMWLDENATIFIRVLAQDGLTERTYTIRQIIGLDNDCSLISIFLDGELIRNFDSDQTFYTHYLVYGVNPPVVTAEARSEYAEVSIREGSAGDTTLIICTAMDGTEKRYYVHFAVSDIDDAKTATENDVILKRIPGTFQLFAATIRKDVSIGLYDQTGSMVFYGRVPVADPNDVKLINTATNKDVLNDVINSQSGLLIDILPNQIYFYVFFTSDKTKVVSGKLIAR